MNVLPESTPLPSEPLQRRCHVVYHAFWDGDLSEKHVASLKTCLNANAAGRADREVWLWFPAHDDNSTAQSSVVGPAMLRDARLAPLVAQGLVVKPFNWLLEFKDVPLLAAVDGQALRDVGPPQFANAVRLALLYKFGGVWFDLDVLWMRSLDPVLARHGHDVCAYRWQRELYPNNAILISLLERDERLERLIAVLRERAGWFGFQSSALTFDSFAELTVLPCTWFDRGWIDSRFYLRDFFSAPRIPPHAAVSEREIHARALLEAHADGAVCYHWHNNWRADVHPDSTFSLLCEALDLKSD